MGSICASVDDEGRQRMDDFLRELEVVLPHQGPPATYPQNARKTMWWSLLTPPLSSPRERDGVKLLQPV
ncbi:hypothetical protein EYF80_028007 [Liparis tanakae]|uniref:Uncharacterized protein n=1 Tax=Liparis tanakae TaxID=230148 RepID=A0A4Z2H949_9TELE|nr:hypothetical protein EYF80_028007 [Liparis tanakae]